MPPKGIDRSSSSDSHSDIPNLAPVLREVDDLHHSLSDLFKRTKEIIDPDHEQLVSANQVQLTEVLNKTKQANEELKRADEHIRNADPLSQGEGIGQERQDFRTLTEGRRPSLTEPREEVQLAQSKLRNTLRELESALTAVSPELSEALRAIRPTESGLRRTGQNEWSTSYISWRDPERKAEELALRIEVAGRDIQRLREQLGQADSHAVSRSTDPSLGEINFKAATEIHRIDVLRALVDTTKLYDLQEKEPGNPAVSARRSLLLAAVDTFAIRGDTVLDKVRNLGDQVADHDANFNPESIEHRYGTLNESEAREHWAQLDFALHAPAEQISNPPESFLNWRNNPS